MAAKRPRKTKKTTRAASGLAKKVSVKTITKQAVAQRRKQRLFAFRRRLHNESINSITHGIGTGMTLSGTALLIAKSVASSDMVMLISAAVYGLCMSLVFLASTLYHSMMKPRPKHFFLLMDHAAIFLAIAGTYTPICLLLLRNSVGYALLGAVWLMAICGILFKTRYINRYQFVSTLIYVVMGWSILIAIRSFTAAMPNQGLILFFFGGGMYTCGTLFYGWRTLPYHRMIWHLFVLAGATLHFMSLYLFVFK